MKKNQFFHIVENNDLSTASGENSFFDLSVNSNVDFKNEEKEKKNFDNVDVDNVQRDILNNLTKRNALNYLGLCNKKENFEHFKCANRSHEKSTLHAHIKCNKHKGKNDYDMYPACIKYEYENNISSDMLNCTERNVSNIEPSDVSNYKLSDVVHLPNSCYSNINQEEVMNRDCVKNKTIYNNRETKRKNDFYCLQQIIHNNLNNNYDKNEIKIFHIYHDNRAECLFNDISVIKFYGHKNICIYENKNYIYNKINTNLFQHNEEKKKMMSFNVDNDIYEYLYKEKIKLVNNKKDGNCSADGFNNKKDESNKEVQYFQFYIHKYPSFLKDKIKTFIHIYNMFSVYPYINHKFIEDGIYSENLKVTWSCEKLLHIRWHFCEENELKEILNDIVLNKKKEHNFDENFMKINDFLYINFLTQEIKILDIRNNQFDENNYIILNGSGLCFSAHYYIMVPYHRYINESSRKDNTNDKNGDANKNDKNYHLTYEYIYLSQLFNIYDDFNICFLYPLCVSYFFYYHLFVKDKIKNVVASSPQGISEMEDIKYNNTCEESYINQLNDIYVKLKNCFKKNILDDTHNSTIKVKGDTIEFLIPQSCYKNFENVEFVNEKSYYLTLLYVICISKHGLYDNQKKLANMDWCNDYNILHDNCFSAADLKDGYNKCTGTNNCSNKYTSGSSNCHCTSAPTNSTTRKFNCDNPMKAYHGEGEKWQWWCRENLLCSNEIKEISNLRNIFPDNIKNYFNTCNKIDNIIKVSIRNDGMCFFYVKSIVSEYLFYSFFILFNSKENLLQLMRSRKTSNHNGNIKSDSVDNEDDIKGNYDNAKKNNNNNKVIYNNNNKVIYNNNNNNNNNVICNNNNNNVICNNNNNNVICNNNNNNIICNNNNNIICNNNNYSINCSVGNLDRHITNDSKKDNCTFVPKLNQNMSVHNNKEHLTDDGSRLEGYYKLNNKFYYLNPINLLHTFNNTDLQNDDSLYNFNYVNNKSGLSPMFANIHRIFEINNIKNVYNDIYICENKKVNTFKLINIMNKEKKKILTPYYFNINELTPLFFLRLSNTHIYDINRQMNKVFEYINYNNKTFTPFLKEHENYEMNVQLDLLENIYTINNELYLLYTKKINYSHDIYKYNYLYVQDYLLKNYMLYYNIYFTIHDELKKNAYYKLKYTNKNKETISIHFTVSFNYVYDQLKSHFQLTPQFCITHIEQNSHQNFEEHNYISFIQNYVNEKCLK
ncbi:hypothetical protein MKS88_005508 [Plasmodium brasilianum]|uniref:Uncharacterized protein n=1 Tax=Plasmodium brasilianum TaxID=5824 RepID=A0ACB9Y2H9_PLABR|nr:hypothetical protein MKS88_005508 [Plasmodium brasilianum]